MCVIDRNLLLAKQEISGRAEIVSLWRSGNHTGYVMCTARTIADTICANLAPENADRGWDTFKAGNAEASVTGVVTCFLATMEVLQEAVSRGANLVITHEPTWYHALQDDPHRVADDPVVAAKLRFIEDHGLIVWRCHDHIHAGRPDLIVSGMVAALQLGPQVVLGQPVGNVFDISAMTLADLARMVRDRCGCAYVRVAGDPAMPCRRVALRVGAPGSENQMKPLRDPSIDAVICGETREWETPEYARDSMSTARPKGMILLGHFDSEDLGMAHFAKHVASLFPDIPVHHVRSGNPLWMV